MHGRYRGAPLSFSHFSCQPVQRTKNCFVCGKVSYWSRNHTQQERDDSKQNFSDHYCKYRTQPGYEQTLQIWIINYEGIENDDEIVAQYFEDLSIDTENDNIPEPESFYIESKQFYTSIGQLESSGSLTVVNTPADNAFKHQITLSDKTVSIITLALYILNLSTDSQYNDNEFKELLIDSGASTQSIGGIR